MSFLKASNRPRLFVVLAALFVSFALALTLAPSASAQPLVPANVGPPRPDPQPTKAQTAQAKIAQRVLDSRPHHKGKTINFRRALRAAGRHHEVIAQDVSLGLMRGGGKITHLSRAQRMSLAARAKKLGQIGLYRKLKSSRPLAAPDPCPGVNSLNTYWWGYRVRLDACRTDKVVTNMETVAFIGGLLATFFPLDAKAKGIMAVSLAIVALGAFALKFCNRRHRGVGVYHATTIGPGDIWCLSQ